MPAGTRIFSALAGVVAQPVGGAGVDVDADVGQCAEDVRGVADQLGGSCDPPGRTVRTARPAAAPAHVRGTDPGRELVDPLLVVPLLLGRREATARLLLPRLEPEDGHLHEASGSPACAFAMWSRTLPVTWLVGIHWPYHLALGPARSSPAAASSGPRPAGTASTPGRRSPCRRPTPVRQRVGLRRRPQRPCAARDRRRATDRRRDRAPPPSAPRQHGRGQRGRTPRGITSWHKRTIRPTATPSFAPESSFRTLRV